MPDAAWVTAGAEEGDLRVALDRLAAVNGDAYARLCGDAVPFWFFSSHLTDARSRLERACADASSSGIDPPVHVLNALTEVLWRMGDASGAMLAASAEVDLCRRLGDDVLLAEALRSRGNVLQAGKDLAGAGSCIHGERRRRPSRGPRHRRVGGHRKPREHRYRTG